MFRNKGIMVSVSTKNVKESDALSKSEPKSNLANNLIFTMGGIENTSPFSYYHYCFLEQNLKI